MKREKVIILMCFILIGLYVIFVASGFPSIPNTMSPGLFPIMASILLVCLSITELVLTLFFYDKKDLTIAKEEEPPVQKRLISKILLVNGMLIAMVLIMRYVYPILGVFVFLFTYLILIAKQHLKLCIPASLIGTAAIYLFIRLLRIPL